MKNNPKEEKKRKYWNKERGATREQIIRWVKALDLTESVIRSKFASKTPKVKDIIRMGFKRMLSLYFLQ